MFRSKRARLSVVVASIIVALSVTTSAIERKPLPPLALAAIDETPVTNEQLPQEGAWVLLYVESPCGDCDHLLKSLKQDDQAIASRLVIIVGGARGTAAAALAANYPVTAGGAWFGDPERQAARALEMHAVPVAIGVRGQKIVWSLAGMPGGPGAVLSAIKSWILRQ